MAEHPKKLIIFDLDGTLTKSKAPIDRETADLLTELLDRKKVAVISGGGYRQFQKQFLGHMLASARQYSNLFLLPTSGTRLYVWKDHWVREYAEDLSTDEKDRIMEALRDILKMPSVYRKPERIYGDLVEDRGSQITFSALGQEAPVEAKYAWDPTREKREHIASILRHKLPKFDVRVGGATSVDITHRGVNKAYGIRKLEQYLGLKPDEIAFVGDALFYGGNDYPARATGVDCHSVTGPEETRALIRHWLGKSR